MVDHVKLEIAIQLVAEKIADLYRIIEDTNDPSMKLAYEKQLEVAFDEKERVARGEIEAIEKIIRERSGING